MRVGRPVRLHPEPYHGARSLCCQGRAGGRAEAIRDAEGIWAAPQILEDREGNKRVRLIGRYLAWFRAPDGWQGVTTFDHGADRDSEAWALDFLDRQRAGLPLYRNGG
jgi:hypothetical protein